MRPRPQCDTVKWQESVAGEPSVQGIYHLKPSDPLCLWERGVREGWSKSERREEVEEEKNSVASRSKKQAAEKEDRKWRTWMQVKQPEKV